MEEVENKSQNKAIITWLLIGCVLIFIMVAIGGITRLTHSGLSMVEWKLFGSKPPTSETDWQVLFDKYKQYPEYQQVNFNFSLEEFKSIFFWEYFHRMFGRFIMLVFVVPFLWFWSKKKISKDLRNKVLIIISMVGFQGLIGVYMVNSGLVKNPDVSHYRLAMHLVAAFLTFAYTFWVVLGLIYTKPENRGHHKLRPYFAWLLPLIVLQCIWGAYVAGLNAGKVYNSWPKMGEQWIAEGVTAMQPFWLNFIDGIAGVQFVHRYMAYLVFGFIIFISIRAKKFSLSKSQRIGIRALHITVGIQFVLGVFTLLYAVPISLGLLHQLGAFLLLGASVYALHRFSSVEKG